MSLSVNGSTGGYGWLFGSASKDSSKTDYASLTSAMFGNSGSILGEYAMIKSGAYQKLLKAYYNTPASTDETKNAQTSLKKKDLSSLTAYESTYKEVKVDADSLNNAAKALSNEKIYEGTEAEDGTVSYDKDAIIKKVNSFVSGYNNYMESTKNKSSASLMPQTYKMQGEILSNTKAMQGIGITYASGKLSVDEEKLKAADVEEIAEVFKGEDSVAGKISLAAADASKVSYSLANTGSMYSASGSYIPSASSLLNSMF